MTYLETLLQSLQSEAVSMQREISDLKSQNTRLRNANKTLSEPSLKQLRWAIYEAVDHYPQPGRPMSSLKMEIENLFKEYTNS